MEKSFLNFTAVSSSARPASREVVLIVYGIAKPCLGPSRSNSIALPLQDDRSTLSLASPLHPASSSPRSFLSTSFGLDCPFPESNVKSLDSFRHESAKSRRDGTTRRRRQITAVRSSVQEIHRSTERRSRIFRSRSNGSRYRSARRRAYRRVVCARWRVVHCADEYAAFRVVGARRGGRANGQD